MMCVNRRTMLKTIGGGVLAATALSSRPQPSYAAEAASLQLSWIPHVEFAGELIAEANGFYAQEGLALNIRPGGPEVDPISLTMSRQVVMGLTSVDAIAQARQHGAAVKIVAATFQKDPTAIMSLADKPIHVPKDMVGKRIGIQSDADMRMRVFCKVNGIDPDSITFVPVSFDPTPLVMKEVDGFVSFLTNQPVDLASKGIATTTMLLSDHGLLQSTDCFVVREDALNDAVLRSQIVRILRATIKGWQIAVDDPEASADAVMAKYGVEFQFNRANQILSAKAQSPLIATDEVRKNGLLTMSEAVIVANIETMGRIGVPTARDLFETDLLKEAFDGKTRL